MDGILGVHIEEGTLGHGEVFVAGHFRFVIYF